MTFAFGVAVLAALAAVGWALALRRRLSKANPSAGPHASMPEDTVAASISRHSVVGTAILDAKQRVVWINDALCNFLWLARGDVLGKPILELFEERLKELFEDGDQVREELTRAMQEREPLPGIFECHVLPGPGRAERWLEHRSRAITHGPLAGGLIEQWTDITPLAKARDLLNLSGQKLNELNRILVDLGTRSELGEGDLSASFREITEVAARTLGVHRTGIWLFNEDRSDLYLAHQFLTDGNLHEEPDLTLTVSEYPVYFGAAETSRVIAADDTAQDPRTKELEDYTQEAGIRAMLDAPIRIRGDLAGVVCFEHTGSSRAWTSEERQFAGSIADFTSQAIEVARQREAEQELHETRAQTARILDGITDAFFHLDQDWRFTYLNRRAESWLESVGISGDDLIGTVIWDAFDVPQDDPDRREFARARATGAASTFTRYNERFGRWLQSHVYPSPEGLAVYVRDVTEHKEAQEALRESETRFRTVVESLGEGLVISDPDGKILYINPRMTKLTGFRPEEVSGHHTIELFVPPEFRERVQAELETRRIGVSNRYEIPLLRKDGSRFWAEIHSGPIRNSEGKITAVVGALTDITERHAAEEALRDSEERFRVLIERAPEAIVVLDPTANEILSINDNFVRLFGRSREELLNTFTPDLSPERQPDGQLSRDKAGELIQRALDGEDPVFEWVHLDGEGNELQCEVRLSRLPWGDRVVIRGSLTDISERKAAEAAIRRSEERYRALFEDDVAGNYVTSVDGFILNCNQAFAHTMGFASAEDAIGTQVVPLMVTEEERQAFLRRVEEEKVLNYRENTGRTLQGEVVHLIENVRGIFDDDGHLVEVHGHVIDVTHRRSLEEQLRHAQKMEAVGQLAGGVAHDFNNLLTAISGHTELLLLSLKTPDSLKDDLERIRGAADRATKLTAQLLAFSRRQVLQPKVLSLAEVVRGMDDMLQRLLGEAVDLTFLHPADPVFVEADPNQVEQTVMNLAVNARDAMPSGGSITVSIDTTVLEEDNVAQTVGPGPGEFAVLRVRDEGQGMSPEVVEHIFEPFYTTKEPGKGTGLGLAMVYGFVHQSGGHVEVESAPGKGTVFSIFLPVSRAAEGATTDSTAPSSGETRSGTETILLVEDEDAVRDLSRRVLEEHGYTVLEADEPRKALIHAEQWPGDIDLLVTNLELPEMDGLALRERVSELRREIRVLYVSGEGASGRAGSAPPELLLTKPFAPSELARRVRGALESADAALGGPTP